MAGTGASRRMASVEVVVPWSCMAARGRCRSYSTCCLWCLQWPYRWLLVVSAAAISIAPCGHRRGRIDCPLWCPPRQYLLLLVVAAAVLSMAPCGFRRGIIDGSLWSPPRPYRSLLAVAAVAILMIYFDEGGVLKAFLFVRGLVVPWSCMAGRGRCRSYSTCCLWCLQWLYR